LPRTLPQRPTVLSSIHRQAGKLLEGSGVASGQGFGARDLRLESYLLVESCCPEAEELLSPAPVAAENQGTAIPTIPTAGTNAVGSFGDLLASKFATPQSVTTTGTATGSQSAPGATAVSPDGKEKPGTAPTTAAKASPVKEEKKPDQVGTPQNASFGLLPLQAVPAPSTDPLVTVNPPAVPESTSLPAAVGARSQQKRLLGPNSPVNQNLISGSPRHSEKLSALASSSWGVIPPAPEAGTWRAALGQGVISAPDCLPAALSKETSSGSATARGLFSSTALSSERSGALATAKEASAFQETCPAQEKPTMTTADVLPSPTSFPAEHGSVLLLSRAAVMPQAALDQVKAADASSSPEGPVHTEPVAAAGPKPGVGITAPAPSHTPPAAAVFASFTPPLAVPLEPQKPAVEIGLQAAAAATTAHADLNQTVPANSSAETPGAAAHAAKGADKQQAKPPQAASAGSGENPRPSPPVNDATLAGQGQALPSAAGHAAPDPKPTASPAISVTDTRQAIPQSAAPAPDSYEHSSAAGTPRSADIPAPLPTIVSTAHVLERMGRSEMRVDVNMADFGNIQLRASVSQDRVGASISTTHIDLRTAMMAEAPSLQQALEQHHLQLGQLDLGAQAGGRQGSGTAQQQPRPQPGWQPGFQSPPPGDTAQTQDSPAPSLLMTSGSSRLNIHV